MRGCRIPLIFNLLRYQYRIYSIRGVLALQGLTKRGLSCQFGSSQVPKLSQRCGVGLFPTHRSWSVQSLTRLWELVVPYTELSCRVY